MSIEYKSFFPILHGLEKENLRINENGLIASTAHPEALGHPLTHPNFTTDFAESQLEVITSPQTSLEDMFAQIKQLYSVASHNLTDELLWPNSMPPTIYDCQKITLANYGKSNEAQFKMIYRRALCYRYRRVMQVISGVHYNFSLSANWFEQQRQQESVSQNLRTYSNQRYFAGIRNYFRHAWILPYLFGASPLCATSSLIKELDYVIPYDEESYFAPYGTSLRLSDLGYQNRAQHLLKISFNSLEEYVDSLFNATQLAYPEFTHIGLYDAQGQRKQLNDHLIQIENEYYSPIRPKHLPQKNKRSLRALQEDGVEYLEVRILDLNPFIATGISIHDAAFIDLFLIYCLSISSEEMSIKEHSKALANINLVATQGRNPNLKLMLARKERPFREVAKDLLHKIAEYFANMDLPLLYQEALAQQLAKANDVILTPSQQILDHMQLKQQTFMEFNLEQAHRHQQESIAISLNDPQYWLNLVTQSKQKALFIEQNKEQSLEDYLAKYLS